MCCEVCSFSIQPINTFIPTGGCQCRACRSRDLAGIRCAGTTALTVQFEAADAASLTRTDDA